MHAIGDMAAPISSGSFKTMGMVVAPCSIRSMAEIASGVTTTLLSRAADVVLKERRRLVLLVRETPLHTGHLRTMTALSEMGAVIAPPVPAFYAKPQTLAEMIDQTLGRILDLFGLDTGQVRRWGETPRRRRASAPLETAARQGVTAGIGQPRTNPSSASADRRRFCAAGHFRSEIEREIRVRGSDASGRIDYRCCQAAARCARGDFELLSRLRARAP